MIKLFKTISLSALLSAVLALSSCTKTDPNAPRAEFIDVYTSLNDNEPAKEAFFSVKGGTITLYIKSNVAGFSVKWQDGNIPAWAKIDKVVNVEENLYAISITSDAITSRTDTLDSSGNSVGLYQKRSGNLLLTKSDQYIGTYFVIHQGFTKRVGTDFAWLEYGSDEPNNAVGDVTIDEWNQAQIAKGYTSTVIEGQEKAWLYGKDGYVRLGTRDNMGADLKIPQVSNFSYDSLLVVSFKAVHQIGETIGEFTGQTEDVSGTEAITPYVPSNTNSVLPPKKAAAETEIDDDVLIVEITGGGVFRTTDGSKPTSLVLHVGTYNRSSAFYPSDIFDNASYLLFICSVASNQISSNTNIRFIAGSMSEEPMASPNRIFIDDLYVYRLLNGSDEDLYQMNGYVNGPDTVLGGRN